MREEQVLSLELAHHKLSDLSPSETVEELPGNEWRQIQRSEGYRWTLGSGDITLEDGEPTGTMSGKLLRHGKG